MSSVEDISCRICLGDKTDGRMISPCKCKGSMRFVHAHCLQQWRTSSVNSKSFFQCDQCLYQYSFRRTWFANLLRNEFILHLITVVCFFFICATLGFVLKWFGFVMPHVEGKSSPPLSVSIVFHMMVGGVGMGLIGFVSLLFGTLGSLLLHGPSIGTGYSSSSSSSPSSTDTARFWIIIIIIIGVCNALYNTYKMVQYISNTVVSQAEYMVENVS